MTRRLALTPVIGLATASMVSFGAVSMWLHDARGVPTHATNPCSTKSVKKTAARTTAAAHTTAGRSPAHLPVLLDATVRTISTGRLAQHATSHGAAATTAGAAATSSTSPPVPSTGPQPSSPAGTPPPLPNPSPGGGAVTPSSSPGNPNPGSNGNVPAKGSGHSPAISPGGTNKSATATPTPTSTPTPTPSRTTTPPPSGTLCLSVQILGGSNTVQPGTTVHFAIWVWLTNGKDGTAKLRVGSERKGVNPTFTVCQPAGKSTCTVSGLNAGQALQSQARLRAFQDLAGRHITVTVSATSKQATNTATASDRITVAAKHSSSSPTPTPTNNGAGTGALPNYGLPGGTGSYAGASNPYSSGSLGSAFPQVSPSPNVSPSTTRQQRQHQAQLTDLSASLPLTVRLIGGQAIGLAILAAAVTIAVARLSLRRQPARHSDDDAGSTPNT